MLFQINAERILSYYIAEIVISPEIEFKIRVKHHLTGDEIRAALIYSKNIYVKEQFHPTYGTRLVAKGILENGQMLIAYLHPLNQEMGIWFLGTAWKI